MRGGVTARLGVAQQTYKLLLWVRQPQKVSHAGDAAGVADHLLVVATRLADRGQELDRLGLVAVAQLRQREDLNHRGNATNFDKLGKEAPPCGGTDKDAHGPKLKSHGLAERVRQSQPRRNAR